MLHVVNDQSTSFFLCLSVVSLSLQSVTYVANARGFYIWQDVSRALRDEEVPTLSVFVDRISMISRTSTSLLNHVRDPPGGLADLVVNARLLLDGAPEAGARDADQGPPTVEVND